MILFTIVFLNKAASDLFGLNEDGTRTNNPQVEPICLPPKSGYQMNLIQTDPTTNNMKGIDAKTGVHEPFEDLDCKLIHGERYIPKKFSDKIKYLIKISDNIQDVPYPYKLSSLSGRDGWLSCHPGGFSHGANINIEGRNSFITAYGSTAREDVDEMVSIIRGPKLGGALEVKMSFLCIFV